MQRPTFQYRFGGLEVSDRFEDFSEGPRLVRTLTFGEKVPEGIYLRLAAGEALALVKGSQDTWQLVEGLRLKMSASAKVQAFKKDEELRLSLKGLSELVLTYYYSAS